jgi:DNA-directed RNA polymerase specialized sigma24 family protein
MEERTAREAADILGIPLGTVLSRLHRARQNLRTWLDPEEES